MSQYRKITFENGIRVVFEKIDFFRSCTMGIWIASGSGYEDSSASGASHFMEHMLFKGSKSRSASEIASQMDEIGGELNAFTTKEYTCVYARSLKEHSKKAFEIIADMVTSPRLAAEDIETEKNVITEEILMYEDSPEDFCADVFYEKCWPGSMYGANILGTRESVASMNRENLLKHLSRFYVPERIVISVCGNFDEDEMLTLCRKYFSKMKNTWNPLATVQLGYKKHITCVKREFEQNQIIIGFPGLPSGDADKYALQLMSAALGSASSSRLFQQLREKLGLVYNIDCVNSASLGGGIFMIYMGLNPSSEKRAITETLQILADFSSSVTQPELDRVREQALAGLVMGLETCGSRASVNGRRELLYRDIGSVEEAEDKLRAVTLEDVKAIADKILDFTQLSICSVGKVHSREWYRKLVKDFKDSYSKEA